MGNTSMTDYDDVLDAQTLQLLGDAPGVADVPPDRMQRLRSRVMQRIDDDITNELQPFLTIRNHDGAWIEIAPKIKKKLLFANLETGIESYLLRAEPGAEMPLHVHELDEHCLVLEGEVMYGDSLHLEAGDYHFAPAGSEHSIAHTDVGALVYIQTAQQGAPAGF